MDSLLYLILTPFCNSHQHLSSLCLPLLASLILYLSGCRAVVVSVMLVVEMEHGAVLQTSPVLRRAGDSFSVSSPATRFMLSRCICHWFSCTALVYQGYRLITSILLHAVLQPMNLQRSWRSIGWSIFLYGICFVKNCKWANLQVPGNYFPSVWWRTCSFVRGLSTLLTSSVWPTAVPAAYFKMRWSRKQFNKYR